MIPLILNKAILREKNTERKSSKWPVIDYIQIICISYLFFLTSRIIKIEVWIALEIKDRLVMQRNKVE